MTTSIALIRTKFLALKPVMDERVTRLWAGAEAEALGDRGITTVAKATGMSRTTIRAGRDELRKGAAAGNIVKVRRAGAGRPSVVTKAPGIVGALDSLIEPVVPGEAGSPLRWTSKSARRLSVELGQKGFLASPQKVGELLRASGYRVQAPERASYSDLNKQFALVNERVGMFLSHGAPVIAFHARTLQLMADRDGREYHHALDRNISASCPVALDREIDEAIGSWPGTIPHLAGWRAVHDAPPFAVRSIAEWWEYMGKRAYPIAVELLVVIEGGDTRRFQPAAWDAALQGVAHQCGLAISVAHLPAGTSKWRSIEHRLVCRVFENWRDRSIAYHETIVALIGSSYKTAGHPAGASIETSDTSIHVTGSERSHHRRSPS